ncbi:hypothetical protein ACFQZ4_24110 [Catellatospora coxensis]|uniref:Uncharacterized protein n=1 Tax=Catellatospora coxensis TaxID=310354 RepID=A0A8J3PAD8_9ACTN|nr:hypothetical protein [Catellatospora coxensis]GIG10201.1 hypothetical protein Cco03nite_69010 [Catellatospora coxensis]
MSHDIGQIVTNLGVTAEALEDADLVADAVVLLKVVQPDGSVSLLIAHSEGMSWIERLGMLRAAERIEGPGPGGWASDDD